MTRDEAWKFAERWISDWNAHDLQAVMTHYDDTVVLTSPVAASLLGTEHGTVTGKVDLRAYFERGLAAHRQLHFELKEVLWGLHSIVLYYANHTGSHTAEFMELSATGKVVRVVANYNR